MTRSAEIFIPVVRTADLGVEELDGEVLVYDLERHKAHCLNGASASIWHAVDGERSVRAIAQQLPDTPEAVDAEAIVWHALAQLDERHLLLTPLPDDAPTAGGLASSRRDLLKKAALVGALGLAIPVVRTIVAPDAAQAATCKEPGMACASSAQCCSGLCLGSNVCA